LMSMSVFGGAGVQLASMKPMASSRWKGRLPVLCVVQARNTWFVGSLVVRNTG
jgi:hypothetical protein